MAPPADLEPFSLFSHFRHHSDTHLTAPLARRSSAIAGAVQSHQATFLLIAGPQRDIFISLSDKYISLRGRNYEENDNLAIYLGAICALLAAISSWYTIAFNDSRFIVPMDLSNYVFRAQDLPIIISGTTPCLVHRVPCCVVFPIYLRKQAQRIDLSVHQNRKSQTGIFRLIRFCRIFRILDLPRRPDHFPLRVFSVFRLFRIFL